MFIIQYYCSGSPTVRDRQATHQLLPMLSTSSASRRFSLSDNDSKNSAGLNGIEFSDRDAPWLLELPETDADDPDFSNLIFFAVGCVVPEPEDEENMSMSVLCRFSPVLAGTAFADASFFSDTLAGVAALSAALSSFAASFSGALDGASRSSR